MWGPASSARVGRGIRVKDLTVTFARTACSMAKVLKFEYVGGRLKTGRLVFFTRLKTPQIGSVPIH